jgi:hypothetical protein
MDRTAALTLIQDQCKTVALAMMKISPTARHLDHPETQAAIFKAAHQLTVELEIIKKLCLRLEKGDDSTLL